MTRRVLLLAAFVFFVSALTANPFVPITSVGKKAEIKPDLGKLVKGEGWHVTNRNATLLDAGVERAFISTSDMTAAWRGCKTMSSVMAP